MLYLARYEVDLDNIETAMAKRLEWDNVAPETMKIVCEYTIHGQPPPFGQRGDDAPTRQDHDLVAQPFELGRVR